MKLLSALLLAGLFIVCSCGDAKRLQYLQGPLDAAKYGSVNYKEPVIQAGDILSIVVYSDNASASAVYNQAGTILNSPSNSNTVASPVSGVSGYLVDNSGNIQFHGIGNVKAKGLTRQQLGAQIADKLKTVLSNPYCQVRFSNFKVTVLGEVTKPSVFTVPTEKVSVLEAIGLAGDLTPFGRRDSVMIVRETDTERKLGWIDLRKTDLFNSEFFYLQQNDVVVVHPTRSKAATNDQVWVRNVTLAATLLSSLAVVYSLLTR